jgi:hypothetical protein
LVLCPMTLYAKGGKKLKKKPELVYKEMADEAPEPLLYEEKVYGAVYIGKWPDAMRILQNGEVWECYDLGTVVQRGRYVHKENLPRIWRHSGEVVPPEEIEKFKEFVRLNEILELPSESENDEAHGCIGGTNGFITIEVDGKRRTLHWKVWGNEGPKILKRIEELVDRMQRRAHDLWWDRYEAYWEWPAEERKFLKMPEPRHKEVPDKAPEPLLVESRCYGGYYGESPGSVVRILHNGQIWQYGESQKVKKGRRNGDKGSTPRVWFHYGEVVKHEWIQKFEEFVRQNRILELPGELRSDDANVVCTWNVSCAYTIEVDGKRHTILWCGCFFCDMRKILQQIDEILNKMWSEAIKAM